MHECLRTQSLSIITVWFGFKTPTLRSSRGGGGRGRGSGRRRDSGRGRGGGGRRGRGLVARASPTRLDRLRYLPHGLLAEHVVELVEHRLDALVLFEFVLSAINITVSDRYKT